MSTDIRLSKGQVSQKIQSGVFLGALLSKVNGSLMNVVVPLIKNVPAPLDTMTSVSAIDAVIQGKMFERGLVKIGKVISLAI